MINMVCIQIVLFSLVAIAAFVLRFLFLCFYIISFNNTLSTYNFYKCSDELNITALNFEWKDSQLLVVVANEYINKANSSGGYCELSVM